VALLGAIDLATRFGGVSSMSGGEGFGLERRGERVLRMDMGLNGFSSCHLRLHGFGSSALFTAFDVAAWGWLLGRDLFLHRQTRAFGRWRRRRLVKIRMKWRRRWLVKVRMKWRRR
jgi:hypothetical protein